jgi:hypothetical protein
MLGVAQFQSNECELNARKRRHKLLAGCAFLMSSLAFAAGGMMVMPTTANAFECGSAATGNPGVAGSAAGATDGGDLTNTACGDFAVATAAGGGATAVGVFSSATGTNSTAIGDAAFATGDQETSVGFNAGPGRCGARVNQYRRECRCCRCRHQQRVGRY